MNYIYKTAVGNISVELDEKWFDILASEDKNEANQERRHTRSDHKYAKGTPILIGDEESADDWLVFGIDTSYKAMDLKIDLEMAIKYLTPLQSRYFVMNRMWGYTTSDIARFEGKSQPVIYEAIRQAQKKIKIFFKSTL